MKRLIYFTLIALLLIIPYTLIFSQETSHWKVGIYGASNINFYERTSWQETSIIDTKTATNGGFTVGINTQYTFYKNFSIITGVNYSYTLIKPNLFFEYTPPTYPYIKYPVKSGLNFGEFPFYINYKIGNDTNRISYNLLAGGNYFWHLSTQNTYYNGNKYGGSKYNSHLQLGIGAGIDYKLSEKSNIRFDVTTNFKIKKALYLPRPRLSFSITLQKSI